MLLTDHAIKSRNAVYILMVALLIVGIHCYVTIPREGPPDITIPYVFVSSFYEGVAPAEIENLITIPLERQFRDLENVKEMTSTSMEGVSMISIEFTGEEDINNALQRVKDKLDLAKQDLPDDLDEPIVQAFNFATDFPILIVALSGDADATRLKLLAEDLQDRIESIPGIKQVSISGTREREIRIEIDLYRLIEHKIPLSTVIRRIAEENRTISAGNLEMGGNKFQVRIPGEYTLATDMRDLVLLIRDSTPIYLKDVAAVSDTFKDLSSISRVNGKPCVSLQIKKRSNENTIALISQINSILDKFQMPEGIQLTIIRDQSEMIRMMLEELENSVVTAIILVLIVLMVAMGPRNSLFVGLAIPYSMLIAFIVIDAMGLTLNMIVLFSLVLTVGMVVDNGIVIVENIYRNRTLGLTRIEAAQRGASEVAWPVITSTLTTLLAFTPLLFWPGMIGQFMGFLPITVIITLSASLFVAIVLNPAVCSLLISSRHPAEEGSDGPRGSRHPILDRYERLLRSVLRYKGRTLLLGLVIFILTTLLFAQYNRGMELFPDTEPRSATIELSFPEGTSIDETDQAMRQIEQKLHRYEDIEFFLTTIGGGGGGIGLPGASGTHAGSIYVEFLDPSEREQKSSRLIEQIRLDTGVIPGAKLKVEKEKHGPPTGAPVNIDISGDDFDVLAELSGKIMRAIQGVPGLVDLRDNMEETLPELQFRVDRQRTALLGLDTAAIGTFLRTAIYGVSSSKFRAGEDEYDITVRLSEDQRSGAGDLDQIFIPLNNGNLVPLSSLGRITFTGGRGAILRKNRKRVITISGDIQERSIDAILKDIRLLAGQIRMPQGYAVSYTGENKEMKESGGFLSKAFMIAIALIFVLLVLQFNSALLPGIIMISVICSLIGVMWGLLICRLRFGVIMTGLGIISLAGVVVNNSIVLIDCINRHKKEGLSTEDALVAAGRMRLRPVLLTAITTILGLTPMAIGYSLEIHSWPWKIVASADTAWWAPMAVAVIFGLGLASVLTLVQVPVMYSLADSVVAFVSRLLKLNPQDRGQKKG